MNQEGEGEEELQKTRVGFGPLLKHKIQDNNIMQLKVINHEKIFFTYNYNLHVQHINKIKVTENTLHPHTSTPHLRMSKPSTGE